MTDSTSVLARSCNSDLVDFLIEASEIRMEGNMLPYDDYQPVPHPPMWLTDRHLASEHSLKRVVTVPNLMQDMANDINREIARFLTENDNFPCVKDLPKFAISFHERIDGPSTIMHLYAYQISPICETVATSMYVLPNQRECGQAYSLVQYRPHPDFLNQAELQLSPDYKYASFRIRDFGLLEEALKNANHATIEKLRVIRGNNNCLATFNFLPPCPESDFIVICAAKDYGPNSWTTPATISPKKLDCFDRPIPLDTPNRWWGEYNTAAVPGPSKRVQRDDIKHRTSVWIPPHRGTQYRHDPEPREFLQRAWCHAVEADTTFMVINSGNKERIGIRHRESQTLFLSDIIEPLEMPYMKLHMFLHVSIFKEAMERFANQPPPDVPMAQKRKLHADIEGRRMSKRLRGESSSMPESDALDVWKEISRRNILLVSFNFGVYHSSSPSSFLRVSPSCHPEFVSTPFQPVKANKKYPFTECMNFVASAKVGSGSAGTVFRGVVQIHTDAGSIIEEKVVLKIPLGAQPVSKIHDEYKFYAKFAKAGITEGILPVYGVFEDVESGSVAMMMRDGGTDLWHRERERDGFDKRSGWTPGQISLSQDEFDVLHRVITRINALNILHGDVKPDNLLCDENGKVSLVDFDQACEWDKRWIDRFPGSAYTDIRTLSDLLAGTFVQDKHYPK